VGVDEHRDHRVEPQQRQIGQIVLREPLAAQVRVDAARPQAPAPARTRLKSGSVMENASPTITYSTRPPRPSSTPTCRPHSNDSSASWRANSCVSRRSRGSLRLYRFSSRRSWLAFSP
jgi:hypothetical protein